mgnify:CR=1 FL=1
MTRLVVVEDEKWVRRAIIDEIDWQEGSFSLVGETSNGPDALTMCRNTRPDIVLSDIRIPGFDGLELISRISKELPMTRFVIISGHDEFDYARRAIRLGVTDYLLKPVRQREVMPILISIRNDLREERSRALRRAKHERRLKTYEELLRTEALSYHEPAPSEERDPRVRHAMQVIEEHYGEPLNLSDIAATAGMGKSSFSQAFKEISGTTFIAYLTQCRLSAARRLLQQPELSISEIANLVGYDDPNYFSRLFKGQHGVTPANFRRSTGV